MPSVPKGYYPPRARWYSRFYYLWHSIHRHLPFDRVQLPGNLTLQQFLVALVIPGFVFYTLRRPHLGRIVLAAYGALVLVAVIGLGTTAATFAYGMMVALHAVSLSSLLGSWIEPSGPGRRVLLALFATLFLGMAVYFPLQRWIQNTLVMPLRIGSQNLMVHPDSRTHVLHPGAVRVFRFGGVGVGGARLGQGYVVAEILGSPGDRIRFEPARYFVNERVYPARPLMPQSGEWLVPENHWFIWPDSSIRVNGALDQMEYRQREAILREMALMSSARVVGRPLRWWFWRNLYVP